MSLLGIAAACLLARCAWMLLLLLGRMIEPNMNVRLLLRTTRDCLLQCTDVPELDDMHRAVDAIDLSLIVCTAFAARLHLQLR